MAKLKLKDVTIELPLWLEENPSDLDIVEWLEYNIGARSDIRLSNKLYNLDLSECIISINEASIDDKPFFL